MTIPKILETAGADSYSYPLMIRRLLPSNGSCLAEIVSEGRRFKYDDFVERVHRLASALSSRGIRAGDTVAVMDWDSHRYLECYFAVPMMGAVLQTVNVRLSSGALAFTLRQSGAKTLLYHHDFLPLVATMLADLPSIETSVSFGNSADVDGYEALIAEGDRVFSFEDFDENAIATTFHTSGTTGDPKQVFFSHRQLVLHTLAAATAIANQPVAQRVTRADVYMPITPMFHVHAWGVPYVATMLGMKQVYPGRYDPAALLRLKRIEGVTFSHCVPTILRMLIEEGRESDATLAPWKMIIGGSALPESLAAEAAALCINAVAGYGMSETGPIVSLARSEPNDPISLRCRAGMPIPLVDVAVDPERGNELTLRGAMANPRLRHPGGIR